MSIKGKMLRALSGFLTEARVVKAEDVGSQFRRVVLHAEKPIPSVEPGTKVQVLLPSDEVRTYSPIPSAEGLLLLAYRNAPGPGGAWARSVTAGDVVHFVGPQKSLLLPPGPVVMVGDETSVAVTAAFEAAEPGRVLRAVFEARDVEAVREAAHSVGLRDVHVSARGDHEAISESAAGAGSSETIIGLTGGSELVVGVRAQLREKGRPAVVTKTYWSPGRAGLD